MWQEGRQRREIDDLAGEGVEEAHDGVMVAVQKKEAVDRVEYDMVIQEREVDTDDGAGGEVDEAHEAAEVGVAGVEAVALGEHHPAARVEAWIEDVRADGARAPVRAGGTEPDVVLQVAGQHTPPDELHQICVEGRPILNS
jgi:hypothetical protein